MKKKLISALLVLALALTLSVSALAADGDAVTDPVGTEAGEGVVPSTGEAIVTDRDFKVAGDDDAVAAPDDTDGADIALWGRITGGAGTGGTVYKLDVAWGNMRFIFVRNSATWDPVTYTYSGGDGVTGHWTLDDNGVNQRSNRIDITNHSNGPVDATLGFAFTPGENGGNIFNTPKEPGDILLNFAVEAHFFSEAYFADEAMYKTSSGYDHPGRLTDNKLSLHTAAAYNPAQAPANADGDVAAGPRTAQAYFAFSGCPDANAWYGDIDAGTITITFAPSTVLTDHAPYGG